MCGKKNLRQEEVKEVCLDCFSKNVTDNLSILELVKGRLSKEDLKLKQQNNKINTKKEIDDYVDLSHYASPKI